MKEYNVIVVISKEKDKVLMCKRVKDPYKGKYNLVGGKIEENESFLDSSYRELEEETGITNKDIILKPLMSFEYPLKNMKLEVFYGFLNNEVILKKELNELYWFDINDDFYDNDRFAGEGNIGVMIKQIEDLK